MKIALVTETFPPEINGVAMTFGVVARELGRRGHAVTVYRPWRRDLASAESHPEFCERSLPGLPIPGYPQLRVGLPAGRQLRRAWREERPDVVHVATEGPLGSSALAAARRLDLPATSSFHTNFHAYTRHYGLGLFQSAALAWLRRVHSRARLTFVPTAELRGELAGAGFRHLTVLTRGVDTRQFRPELRSEVLRAAWGADGADRPVVLHVGRLASEKNYPLLFQAFDAMRAAEPRCRFVLVGDGPLRRSLERARPDFIFTGFIPRDELARHYASADIYVHPSLTETFGNVLTEALASGLAVATFDYAAGREFVRHEENGLVAPREVPPDLVSAAVRLASDPGLRLRLRRAARSAVELQSWTKVIACFEGELAHAIA